MISELFLFIYHLKYSLLPPAVSQIFRQTQMSLSGVPAELFLFVFCDTDIDSNRSISHKTILFSLGLEGPAPLSALPPILGQHKIYARYSM